MASFTLPPRGENDGSKNTYEGSDAPKKDYPVIPDGEIVEVEVVEVEERDRPEWAIRSADDEKKEISFRFRVINGPYEKANLWGNTMPWFDYSPKCKLRLWVQGIEGTSELPEGFQLRSEVVDAGAQGTKTIFPDLAGKRARILVGNRRNKTTGVLKHFVQDVFPAKQFEDVDDHF